MSTLELRRVSKSYGSGGRVVADLDLEVDDGELFVLLGPSGCGKTTVLRMIAGLEDVTSGEVVVDGAVINDVTPSQRDIAMAFQSYALYPHMTVAENIGASAPTRSSTGRSARRGSGPRRAWTSTDRRATSPILVAMDSAVDINVWEPLTLRVDTNQIHLFDLATGASLR